MEKELTEIEKIERSLIKKYRSKIWAKFVQAVDDYKLIKEGDRVAVCMSGGKDSFLMAKLFQELQKHWTVKFECIYLVMNPGYTQDVLDKIKSNAEKLQIDVQIFDTNIFNYACKSDENACFLCARMRRGYLYREAQRRGCNKIALGHHFDDVIETTLISMLYAGQLQTMVPKLKSDNVLGMELIRPMYKIREEDIISWCKHNNLEFINCACTIASKAEKDASVSKRKEVKELIKELKKKYEIVDTNIFKSMENVNLNMVLGYKKGNEKYSYLDDYEENKNECI